ncbi:hypothetical protein LTR27_003650 [Elasticomyces elasticus]|nr:hypothetical protein LTR27_003650 [Elasticomyces elasticus]
MDGKPMHWSDNYSTLRPEDDSPDYPPPPYDDVAESSSTVRRRYADDPGLVAPLALDVPPPNEPTNVLNQMCARQQAEHARKADEKSRKH